MSTLPESSSEPAPPPSEDFAVSVDPWPFDVSDVVPLELGVVEPLNCSTVVLDTEIERTGEMYTAAGIAKTCPPLIVNTWFATVVTSVDGTGWPPATGVIVASYPPIVITISGAIVTRVIGMDTTSCGTALELELSLSPRPGTGLAGCVVSWLAVASVWLD